jgi:hypothetical protein
VFAIEIEPPELRESLSGFLAYKVPGVVSQEDSRLDVILRGDFPPEVQERLLERLITAWKVERKITPSVQVRIVLADDRGGDDGGGGGEYIDEARKSSHRA